MSVLLNIRESFIFLLKLTEKVLLLIISNSEVKISQKKTNIDSLKLGIQIFTRRTD